jgi:hypothetical protein
MLPSTGDVAAVARRFPEFSPSDGTLTIKDPDGIAITFES